MSRVWSGYKSGGRWNALEAPSERWLMTSMPTGSMSVMTVHYNLLNGRLLVNGCLLARLPQEYEAHQTYRRLFGKVSLPTLLTFRFPKLRSNIEEFGCGSFINGRTGF